MDIFKQKGKICINGCDEEFFETLNEEEKDYIRKGDNWISKMARQEQIRHLKQEGKTLKDI